MLVTQCSTSRSEMVSRRSAKLQSAAFVSCCTKVRRAGCCMCDGRRSVGVI